MSKAPPPGAAGYAQAPPPYGQPYPYPQGQPCAAPPYTAHAGVPAPGGYKQPPQPMVYAQPPPQRSGGLFGQLRKEWDCAVNTFDKYARNGVSAAELFVPGNTLQLVSRTSGRAIQIVQAPSGQLVVDANGAEGPNTFNALWTVGAKYSYIVQIHNNFNYLAIENGVTCVKYYPTGSVPGRETKLRVISVEGHFVYLASDLDDRFHIGFDQQGIVKSALATGRDSSSQFAVRLISGAAPAR